MISSDKNSILQIIICLLLLNLSVTSDVSAVEIDFNRDIQPILSENCFHCHGPDIKTREADLRLDTQKGAFADLGGYQAIVPGDAEDSEVYLRLISDDKKEVMPPRNSNRKLTPKQIDLIKQWINSGAKWSEHWSFSPLNKSKPEIPKSWGTNEIDYYVWRKLQHHKLNPSPQATRRQLIRRVTLDLTGLPPTPEEVNNFISDKDINAYEKVVDRLLESKAYGERMAWPWLDAARYADTNGYQGDRERTMWPWRDWVIDSFNNNMPYDQFSIWQLAGDLLPNPTHEQKLATAFNRNHMINGEGGRIAEENRVEYVFDQLETAGTIWMGLTFNCCRCHDHKYDPLSKEDYYSLFAYFNKTPVDGSGGDPATPPVIRAPDKQQLQQIAQLQNQYEKYVQSVSIRETFLLKQQSAWEQSILNNTQGSLWHSPKPIAAKAQNQQLTILPDHSILSSGNNPANDTYTITLPLNQGNISAIRLDTLKHKSLKNGGLSHADSGNYVLTGFELELINPDGKQSRNIKIKNAQSTFDQGGLKVNTAYDGNKNTGWAVWNGRNVDEEHAAVFVFDKPIDVNDKQQLKVTMRHDSKHALHIIGRFKLSITEHAKPSLNMNSEDLINAINIQADKRTKAQTQIILTSHRDSDTEYKSLVEHRNKIKSQIDKINNTAPKVMVMHDASNRKTYMLTKGLYNLSEGEVHPKTPHFLPTLQDNLPKNRLGLAKWLMNENNPLTARVTVNRIWQEYFGIGLVKTTEDFGTQGERPVYPELLDWVAQEFINSKWDMKKLCKLIVMSSTYRQSSIVTSELLEIDPENRLLARGARFRMPSWMIRDQALAASGLLNRTMGGPSVNSYQPAGVWAEATFGKKKYQQTKGDALDRKSVV